MCIYVRLDCICPVGNVVNCRELVGQFVYVGKQECKGGQLFILARKSFWVCVGVRQRECRDGVSQTQYPTR